MSKQVAWSTHSTGKSRQSAQSYQPGWMAHWMRTSSNATAERLDDTACANKDLDRVSRDDHTTLEATTSVKDPGKIEADNGSLRLSSKGFRNEGLCSAQIEHGQETGATIGHNTDCGQAMNFKGGIQAVEGTSVKALGLVKTHFSAHDIISSTSMYSQERCVGRSTHIVPYHDLERYKFDKGKAVVSPPITRHSIFFSDQLPDTKLKRIEQERGQKHFRLESEMGNQSEPDTSINACFGDRNTSFLSGAPSMNDQDHPICGKDWLQKMQKCSHVMSLLPSQSSEKNELKVPYYDGYPLQKFPSRVHESMRICTAVDSVEAPPRARPWFSQTTHSLFITKKTDANVSEETDALRSLVTKIRGNSSSVLECIPPFFDRANRGVTLQPISSSNSEGQGNAEDTGIGTSKYASKNESSAETDTMDMEFSEERANCGASSARSPKVFNFEKNPSPRIDAASSREVGCSRMSSGLPVINLELPALPAVASSSADMPTSSRTQSLEMDMLLVQAEPKSNPSLHDSPKADPTTRWVKRLKLSSSETSAQGSKSSKLTEKLSHDKKREVFRSILKKGITGEQHGRETFLMDTSRKLSKEDEHLPADQPKISKEMLLSHVWIKRWLRNGSQISQRKPQTVVVCEPQRLTSSLDELPKKQFPSIAAMALMGRTMSGFQSCELQKRGSFTIWNTNTL